MNWLKRKFLNWVHSDIAKLHDEYEKTISKAIRDVEIKVHDSKWTNYEVTYRINKNEVHTKEFVREKLTKS